MSEETVGEVAGPLEDSLGEIVISVPGGSQEGLAGGLFGRDGDVHKVNIVCPLKPTSSFSTL